MRLDVRLAQQIVLRYVAEHHGEEIRIREVAEAVGAGERTVRRHLITLRAWGYVEYRVGSAGPIGRRYVITTAGLEALNERATVA